MKNTLPVTVISRRFEARDLVGGDAALDFVNTVNGRDRTPCDWLDSYSRLLEWAALARLLPESALRALERKARRDPTRAASALARAKVLREALFTLVTEWIAGRAPPKDALDLLRKYWIKGVDAHQLRFGDGRVVAELRDDPPDFDLVASMVGYRMVEYVLPLPTDRLRICRGSDCAWLFFDSSKAGRRRWCDMAVCGNAAKSRRFYARSQRRRSDPRP